MSDYIKQSKEFDMSVFISNMKKDEFVRKCRIPMGYSIGYPILAKQNDVNFILVPLLRYKITGKPDKTLVYPIRYYISYSLNECKFNGFCDLKMYKALSKIDFSKPIGLFRHDEIKNLTKAEYTEKKNELYACYTSVIRNIYASLANQPEEDISEAKAGLANGLKLLLEPCEKPFYKLLAKDFYEDYLA